MKVLLKASESKHMEFLKAISGSLGTAIIEVGTETIQLTAPCYVVGSRILIGLDDFADSVVVDLNEATMDLRLCIGTQINFQVPNGEGKSPWQFTFEPFDNYVYCGGNDLFGKVELDHVTNIIDGYYREVYDA